MSESGSNARVRLIRTRRGTWVDESLFPEARRECLEILERVARDLGEDGIVEMLRGYRERLEGYPLGDLLREWGIASPEFEWLDRFDLNWAGLQLLSDKLREYDLPEEREAWRRAASAALRPSETCGSCSRDLRPRERVHFGAQVYVGFPPLIRRLWYKPRIAEPRYRRTVLCESCTPRWLSPENEGVVTQLCAHCERPMVYRLTPSELGRSFCSDPCGRAYRNQLLREGRAEARKKVCEVCGAGFVAARKDAKTCSPGCKQKAYRWRKKEAKRGR